MNLWRWREKLFFCYNTALTVLHFWSLLPWILSQAWIHISLDSVSPEVRGEEELKVLIWSLFRSCFSFADCRGHTLFFQFCSILGILCARWAPLASMNSRDAEDGRWAGWVTARSTIRGKKKSHCSWSCWEFSSILTDSLCKWDGRKTRALISSEQRSRHRSQKTAATVQSSGSWKEGFANFYTKKLLNVQDESPQPWQDSNTKKTPNQIVYSAQYYELFTKQQESQIKHLYNKPTWNNLLIICMQYTGFEETPYLNL